MLWLAGLGCVVFLVGRLWFTYSGLFFNWLLRSTLSCRGTSIRLHPLRFVFVLHGVKFEASILHTVEASGLGGYLPCKLESMHVAELELALQLVPLLRFLWHLVRQLTRRRSSGDWKQEGLGYSLGYGLGYGEPRVRPRDWKQEGLDSLEAQP